MPQEIDITPMLVSKCEPEGAEDRRERDHVDFGAQGIVYHIPTSAHNGDAADDRRFALRTVTQPVANI